MFALFVDYVCCVEWCGSIVVLVLLMLSVFSALLVLGCILMLFLYSFL